MITSQCVNDLAMKRSILGTSIWLQLKMFVYSDLFILQFLRKNSAFKSDMCILIFTVKQYSFKWTVIFFNSCKQRWVPTSGSKSFHKGGWSQIQRLGVHKLYVQTIRRTHTKGAPALPQHVGIAWPPRTMAL